MKPSLQLNIGQQLTLTPQLQQAIRLLQLSTLDLQQEIQQAVESNPMLEATPVEPREEPQTNAAEREAQEEFSDVQWSQLYSSNKNTRFEEYDYNYENLYCTTTNLQDHLQWQIDLSPMSDLDRLIAAALIDAIDHDGQLTVPPLDIQAMVSTPENPVELAEVEAVRHRIQLLDPVGCGFINLAETLLIQLDQLPDNLALKLLCRDIIQQDLELIAQHQFKALCKKYQVSEDDIHQVMQLIHNLNPKPGNQIHQDITEYIIPDLTVKKVKGEWQVQLNQEILPRLSINSQYAALIQRADNSADNQYLKNNLQEARWFLKSIQSRQDTLLKVARAIVDYQKDYFELGEEAMKPLILNDVAQALDMHESTISRVTTQKFMHTPRGVFELKYFFSSHVATANGGECSSTAIRAMIKKLIAAENRQKPLSDNKIAELIEGQGIQIARRTVAKYREALGIAPSSERRSRR